MTGLKRAWQGESGNNAADADMIQTGADAVQTAADAEMVQTAADAEMTRTAAGMTRRWRT